MLADRHSVDLSDYLKESTRSIDGNPAYTNGVITIFGSVVLFDGTKDP